MDLQSLGIAKFDIAKVLGSNMPPVIAVIGRSLSGKSFLIRDLYRQTNCGLSGIVLYNRKYGNERSFYKTVLPEEHIHGKYSSDIVQSVIYRQRTLLHNHEENKENLTGTCTRTCLVVEDSVLVTVSQAWDTSIRDVFMNGRHLGITLIVAMQYPIELDPVMRNNVDYVLIMADHVESNRRRFYDRYADVVFDTFEHFCTVLDAATQNYGCMVIKMHGSSKELSERVFWYKAQ